MRLITWNVQWCRGVDGRVDPRRIVAHARALADFDVLCLQEVAAHYASLPGSRGENQFERLARLLPGYTAIPGAAVDRLAPDGGRSVFGNAIFSRLPVAQVLRWQLPWPCDAAAPRSMPRLLLEAVIESPAGALRVMTTHLEYYSASQRAAQVEAIRARHAEACGRASAAAHPTGEAQGPFRGCTQPAPAVVCGDFNLKPDDPLHERLRAPFDDGTPELIDAWQQLHPGEPHAHTNGLHDRVQWPSAYTCDYVFVSGDLAPRLRALHVDPDTQASDHQPLLLELE